MSNEAPRQGYRWPWFVLAGLIVAVLLAALWMSYEIRRTKRIQELNSSPSLPSAHPGR